MKVDTSSNRLYITIKGFWRDKGNYLGDLETACRTMNSGFKIHVDLTGMKAPKPEVGKVHEDAQKMLMQFGLSQTAEVHGRDAIARMALNKYSTNSGMDKQVFSTHDEAKAWLDQSQ